MISAASRAISAIEKLLLSMGMLSSFINPFNLVSTFLVMHIGIAKLPVRMWLLMIFCFFFLGISIFKGADIINSILVWRFYFGFILFLPFFTSVKCHDFFIKLVYVLILSLFIETFVINVIIDAEMMPNFPNRVDGWSHYAEPGDYQRPMSFAGVASFSAVIFVVLIYEFLDFNKKSTYLLLLSVISLLASGNGFIAFFIYQLKNITIKNTFYIIILIALGAILLISLDIEYKGLDKISSKYINFLIEYKSIQIIEIVGDFSAIEFLIGGIGIDQSGFGGDFGLLLLIENFGFLSLFMYFMLLFFCPKNKFPIFVLLLTSMHYPVAFSFVGQILFAYFIGTSMNKQTAYVPTEKIEANNE